MSAFAFGYGQTCSLNELWLAVLGCPASPGGYAGTRLRSHCVRTFLKMLRRKCLTRVGFEIQLKFLGLLLVLEAYYRLQNPGTVFSSMLRFAKVMCFQSALRVTGIPCIVTQRFLFCAQNVDIIQFGLSRHAVLPLEVLRLIHAERGRSSNEWWLTGLGGPASPGGYAGTRLRSHFVRTKPRGAEESRTPDLCNANAALSQLSYGPRLSMIAEYRIWINEYRTTENLRSWVSQLPFPSKPRGDGGIVKHLSL